MSNTTQNNETIYILEIYEGKIINVLSDKATNRDNYFSYDMDHYLVFEGIDCKEDCKNWIESEYEEF